jgi:hypothetical protein
VSCPPITDRTTAQPGVLHGSYVGHGWTYVRVADPDVHFARALCRGTHVLNEPHSAPDGGQQRGYSARDREGNIWTFAIQEFGRWPHRSSGRTSANGG